MSYRRENARRDRLYGVPEPNAKVDTHELADKVPEIIIVWVVGLMTEDDSFLFRLPHSDMLSENVFSFYFLPLVT